MHHIVDMGIAAHGIFSGKRIIMQPGQIPQPQTASVAPVCKFRRFDELAMGVGALANQFQDILGTDDGK